MPANAPSGLASQRLTAIVRLGSASSSTPRCLATALRRLAPLGQNQDLADRRRIPTKTLPSDDWTVARLRVEWPERPFDRTELRLELDHEQNSGRRVPAEDVNGPAVSVAGECDLELNVPAVFAQQAATCGSQRRVAFVEKPVETAPCCSTRTRTTAPIAENDPSSSDSVILVKSPFSSSLILLRPTPDFVLSSR